jgi:hypothetical protein
MNSRIKLTNREELKLKIAFRIQGHSELDGFSLFLSFNESLYQAPCGMDVLPMCTLTYLQMFALTVALVAYSVLPLYRRTIIIA